MTTEPGTEPSIRAYLAIVRQQRWWVMGAALLGLAAGVALSLAQKPVYTASAQVLVRGMGISTAAGVIQQPITPTDVQTEMQLVTSAPVRQAVQRVLGSAADVTASEVGQTDVISISASSTDPAWSARVANTYAQSFVTYQRTVSMNNLLAVENQLRAQISGIGKQIRALRNGASSPQGSALLGQQAMLKGQLAQMEVSGAAAAQNVQFVTPAVPPVSPSSPGPWRSGGLGLGAGLMVGLAVGFLRHTINDTLTSKDAAERIAGVPALGVVPRITSRKRHERSAAIAVSEPTSPVAEAYRSLRTSIQFIRQERELRIIVVTSSSASEGKTTLVANLGAVFAQAGERVVLVSSDLRRPRLGEYLGFGEAQGFTSVLLGQASLAEVLRPIQGQRNLWALGSGPVPPNPAELLNGSGARNILASLREDFDLVLVDSPPLLPVTDAAVLSKVADGTLLIAATGQTRQGEFRRATEKLRQINTPVIGIVLNQLTKHADNEYGYRRSYRYRHGYKPYPSASPAAQDAIVPDGGISPEGIQNP